MHPEIAEIIFTLFYDSILTNGLKVQADILGAESE